MITAVRHRHSLALKGEIGEKPLRCRAICGIDRRRSEGAQERGEGLFESRALGAQGEPSGELMFYLWGP